MLFQMAVFSSFSQLLLAQRQENTDDHKDLIEEASSDDKHE